MNNKLHTRKQEALDALLRLQGTNGNFTDRVFHESFVLECLTASSKKVVDAAERSLCFIIENKNDKGSFNYDPLKPGDTETRNYPDDLDDTFISLSAISKFAPGLIDEKLLLDAITLLVHNETKEGGPYYTWIVSRELRNTWNDVDIVVNSNVYAFLVSQDITLDAMDAYFDEKIRSLEFSSMYYHRPVIIVYFLAKWYRGPHCKLLRDFLMSQRKGDTWENQLETSLAISAYLNLGGDQSLVEKLMEKLLDTFEVENAKPYPLFIERIQKGETSYSGSVVCTIASFIEACETYAKSKPKKPSFSRNEPLVIIEQVIARAIKKFSNASNTMKKQLDQAISKIRVSTKGNEVFLLPYWFHKKMYGEFKCLFSKDQVIDLCAANLLGWIGYGIYDDLLDDEGDVSLIPLANRCTGIVRGIFAPFGGILDGIGEATLWERSHCKRGHDLPDYGNHHVLAEKSLGHAIGPMILAKETNMSESVREFFVHYLIARQLNDDAHDWLKDLEKGFVNPVSALILKHRGRGINIAKDSAELQETFWYEVLDDVVTLIRDETSKARRVLPSLSFLESTEFLDDLLKPAEQACIQAVSERDEAIRFLEAYRKELKD